MINALMFQILIKKKAEYENKQVYIERVGK